MRTPLAELLIKLNVITSGGSTTRMMQVVLDLLNKQLEQGLQVGRGAEGAVVCSRVQHPTCC